MNAEAQLKIRGLIQLALGYVVEPQPLSVPAVPETLDGLIEQLQNGLNLNGSEPVVAPVLARESQEEVWDGESFGNRLAGLGKLVANDVTKVSLACKPPAESKTVIGMVEALGETCFRLAGFVDSIPVKVAGQTYKREVQILSNNIFEAVAGLLNAFLEQPDERVLQLQNKNAALKGVSQGLSRNNQGASSESGSGANKDFYLIKTGIVWEACEIFEKASRSNREAVAKKWGDMMSTMEDAIAEVKEMIDSNDEKDELKGDDDDEDDSGNESDDSWNDDEKMTEEEKQLSIQANSHLKLTRLLLKKLQQRCLDTQQVAKIVIPSANSQRSDVTLQPSDLARMWDQLYEAAQGIVALADEIATSLYSPQDQAVLMTLLRQLSRKNHDCILVGRLFVKGQADQEQWMDMCEAQSKKILDAIVLLQS